LLQDNLLKHRARSAARASTGTEQEEYQNRRARRAPRGRLRVQKVQDQNQRAVPVRQANTLPWAPHHARTAAETGLAQLLPGLVRHVQPAQLPVIRAILPEILPVLLATPVSTRHHRTAGTATSVELANIKSPVARRIARRARRANPRLSWPQQPGRFAGTVSLPSTRPRRRRPARSARPAATGRPSGRRCACCATLWSGRAGCTSRVPARQAV